NGLPRWSGWNGSSRIVMFSPITFRPIFPERKLRPSCTRSAPKEIQDMSWRRSATAAGSRTTVYRPGSQGFGSRERSAFSTARASVRAEALGLRIECVHGAVGLRSRKREQLRDLGLMARGFLGALDQLGHSLRAQVVSRRTAGALSLDDPDGEQVPALLDVLG